MGQALSYGGPVVMTWGWLAVSALNVTTALCLAELAACMPAAIGSIYVFTARLAPWWVRVRYGTCVIHWAEGQAAAAQRRTAGRWLVHAVLQPVRRLLTRRCTGPTGSPA